MTFYLFTTFFILIFGLIGTYGKNKEFALICRFIVFIWLYFFSAVRYGIGTDYPHYEASYIAIGQGKDFYKSSEPLYYYLAYFCNLFNFSFKIFIAITSFLTIYFFGKSINKKYFVYEIILYYVLIYVQAFCLIRQMLALTISIYALKQYRENMKKCLIILIIASLFHSSFWLIVVLYFFHKKIRFSYYTVCFLVPCLFVFMCFTGILPIMISLALKMLHIPIGIGYFMINRHIGPVMLIRYVFIFLFFMVYRGVNRKDYLVNILILAMFFSEFIGSQLGMFAARLPQTMYASFFLVFGNEYSSKLSKNIQTKNIYFSLMIICIGIAAFIFFVQLATTHNLNHCMPYKSFLF